MESSPCCFMLSKFDAAVKWKKLIVFLPNHATSSSNVMSAPSVPHNQMMAITAVA